MTEQSKEKISNLIREFIRDVPQSSVTQVNGGVKKSTRPPSNWNVFLKKYLDEHRKDGKLDKPFGELSKEASCLYKQGAGIATAPRQPELSYTKFIAPRPDDVHYVGADVSVPEKHIDAVDPNLTEGGLSFDSIMSAFKSIRMNFRPSSCKNLEKYGSRAVGEIKICRKPIDAGLQLLAKSASTRVLPYDKLYHLSMVFKVKGFAKRIIIDKREVLHVSAVDANALGDCISVKIPANLTIDKMLAVTRQKVGDERFFKYKASSTNCQRFILDILESNNLETPELKKFILQDVRGAFSDKVSKIADTATDLLSRVDVALAGEGKADAIPKRASNSAKTTAIKRASNSAKTTAIKRASKLSVPNTQQQLAPDLKENVFLAPRPESVRKDLVKDFEERAEDSELADGGRGGKQSLPRKPRKQSSGPRKQSLYSVSLRAWNDIRISQGHKYMIPKKGTDQYEELQLVKELIKETLID